jgi:hypothetical protein
MIDRTAYGQEKGFAGCPAVLVTSGAANLDVTESRHPFATPWREGRIEMNCAKRVSQYLSRRILPRFASGQSRRMAKPIQLRSKQQSTIKAFWFNNLHRVYLIRCHWIATLFEPSVIPFLHLRG